MATNQVAFEAKATHADPDQHGTVFVDHARTFNVRDALQEGRGFIVTGDQAVAAALDRYPGLKRATVTEAQEAQAAKQATDEKQTAKGKPEGGER